MHMQPGLSDSFPNGGTDHNWHGPREAFLIFRFDIIDPFYPFDRFRKYHLASLGANYPCEHRRLYT